MNGVGETAVIGLIVVGGIAVIQNGVALVLVLRKSRRSTSPKPPVPPKTPAAAPADIAPEVAADPGMHLADAA